MRSFALTSLLLAGLSSALPQPTPTQSCDTTVIEVIQPTSTYTFPSTVVETVTASTADDLGTYTEIVRLSTTRTLATVPTTTTDCTSSGTITAEPVSTVYTTSSSAPSYGSPPSYGKQRRDESSPAACTVTSYSTTTYGVTETYLPASETRTFTEYTAFTQATVTSTSTGGTAFAIATSTVTTEGVCGPTVTPSSSDATRTTTQDARCAPTALTSAVRGFGLEYESLSSQAGVYQTTTEDASECCQLCTEQNGCAASSWDIRNNRCRLHFPTDYQTGDMNCGQGVFAYYDAGPNHPMAPGTGLYIGIGCGSAGYGSAKPDDGT